MARVVSDVNEYVQPAARLIVPPPEPFADPIAVTNDEFEHGTFTDTDAVADASPSADPPAATAATTCRPRSAPPSAIAVAEGGAP